MVPFFQHHNATPNPNDPWWQLHGWLSGRAMLKAIPKEALREQIDQDEVSEVMKLVDIGIRDCVRRIHAAILDSGMPKDVMLREPRPKATRERCPTCGHVYNVTLCPCCQKHPYSKMKP